MYMYNKMKYDSYLIKKNSKRIDVIIKVSEENKAQAMKEKIEEGGMEVEPLLSMPWV